MRKKSKASKGAANKQAKMQRNSNGVTTDQRKEKKHAQPANVREISNQNGRSTLKESLPSNKKGKKCPTSTRASNKQPAQRQGNAEGAPTEQLKVQNMHNQQTFGQ